MKETMNTPEELNIPSKRRKRYGWLWILASPFILFALLCVLLYLPPVQRFAVNKASEVTSDMTGLDIRVGRLALRFPLDLVVDDVLAVTKEERDTLLSLDRMKVELRFWKLLKKEIEIEEISLQGATVDSRDFLEGMSVKGHLGKLFLESHGVIFSPETARIDEFSIKDAQFSLNIDSLAASTDSTTSEPIYWKIFLEKIDLQNVGFDLKMPKDSLSVRTRLAKLLAKDGVIDLNRSSYFLKTIQLEEGSVAYGMGAEPLQWPAGSLNPSHLSFESIDLHVDSAYYCGRDIRANLSRFDWKERSGLELLSSQARVECNDSLINVPRLVMKTTASSLNLEARAGWDVLELKRTGVLGLRMSVEIGQSDVLKAAGGMIPDLESVYPSHPLLLNVGAEGNLSRIRLMTLKAALDGAFQMDAEGELRNLTDATRMGGEINLLAESHDMEFLKLLTDGNVAVPEGTSLEGKFTLDGEKMKTDLMLKQPQSVSHPDSLQLPLRQVAHLFAEYDTSHDAYLADLEINELDVNQFLPKDSIYEVTLKLHADGEGLDVFAPQTRFNVQGMVSQLHYATYELAGYDLTATLEKHRMGALLTAKNPAMDVSARLDAKLKPNDVAAHLQVLASKLDWQVMKLMQAPFMTSHKLDVSLVSDLQQKYVLNASLTDTSVEAPKRKFKTKDLFVGFSTSADSTMAYVRAGDLDVNFEGKGYVETLIQQADVLTARMNEQWATKAIAQEELKALLPGVCLRIQSGKENPICNYLSMVQGFSFDRLYLDMDTSPEEGVNGEFSLYGMHNDSLMIDTISLDLIHSDDGLEFLTRVVSTAKPKQEAFEALLEGEVGNGNAEMLLQYLNDRKEKGIYMGMRAALGKRGIRMRFFPEDPILVFRPFQLNQRNYLYLADRGRIYGDVRLTDEQGTGLHFYTNREDTIANQEMTVELSRINLGQFRQVLPYLPNLEGWLGASLHYVDSEGKMMVSSDVRVDDFSYEGHPMGNWEMSAAYLPDDESGHHVDGYVMHNEQEIVYMNGVYHADTGNGDRITGDLELNHFPLYIINPFVPDGMVNFTGYLDGTLLTTGRPSKPELNGGLKLDSVNMAMPDLSVNFRFDDKQVKIEDSRMIFDKFNIYTKGSTPFAINGYVDFSNIEKMMVDMRMKTNDYELMNAPKSRKAMTYGKIYVDVDATLQGPVDELVMRGNMNVLGKTDFTYVLVNSPLMVTDRLDEMVTFVNFQDTAEVAEIEKQTVPLTGMDIAMTIHIDQAVQAHVHLTPDGSNYMEVEGGGDLAFQYTPQGEMKLNGRYSLISGELKYEIPIIPLKTFKIQNGSYLSWTGNVMNPEMNLKATERVRASVGSEGGATRMVSFDVGIALTDRLEYLGLAFTLEAPEDASVQEQLNTMSAEERSKLAVTMLVTGMYMAEGNSTGGFNVNNALNSFLQNQISNVVGQSMDVSLGMESTDREDGGKSTDYNFQFARRFWNNRFRIVIGGTVSTGNAAQKDETFIDNVAIEYRLDNSGTRYVKLFHEKNYESVLEGEVVETGVGVVLRKKVSNLGELFIFKKKKDDDENED